MSITHHGNIQPQLDYEEHQGDIDAKRVVLIDKDTGDAYDFGQCVSLASGSAVKVTQNTAWSDPKTYIGLATVNIGSCPTVQTQTSLAVGANYIGLASVNISPIPTGAAWIGLASVSGNVVSATGANYIGLASVNISPIPAGAAYIGLASVNISPIPTGSAWVGLASVTGTIKIAGSTKTVVNVPISINASGSATLCVPTNKFRITHMLLSSDATVTVNIKSGATYLVGNASIGVSLVPGGGWVENGSTDAPVLEGLVNAAALVLDTNSATAKLAGKVMYFDE